MGLSDLAFRVFFKGWIMPVRAEMLQMPVSDMKNPPFYRGALREI